MSIFCCCRLAYWEICHWVWKPYCSSWNQRFTLFLWQIRLSDFGSFMLIVHHICIIQQYSSVITAAFMLNVLPLMPGCKQNVVLSVATIKLPVLDAFGNWTSYSNIFLLVPPKCAFQLVSYLTATFVAYPDIWSVFNSFATTLFDLLPNSSKHHLLTAFLPIW